jgi:hypothetical protein
MDWVTEELGFDSQHEQDTFLFSIMSRLLRAHTASCIMGTGGYFPGIKQQGHEADHSPSTAKVKNGGLYFHSYNMSHGVVLN